MASSALDASAASKTPLMEVGSGETKQQQIVSTQKSIKSRQRTKSRANGLVAQACAWMVAHQLGISITLLSLLGLTNSFLPAARQHTQKYLHLSYYNPRTGRYALGWDDIYYVAYWVIIFTGLRSAAMEYLLTPFAVWCGLNKPKAVVRFAEQAWIFIYPTISWTLGMYIMYHSDYWFNLPLLWKDWPVREMTGLFKWYYMVQAGFWVQQIIVVNIEEKRKDYWQMFIHHIITCSLIYTSYGYHYYKVGNVVLCLMDVVDLFLPVAKMLRYLRWKTACDTVFALFMLTWFIARHVFFMCLVWSIVFDSDGFVNYGCYKGTDDNLQGPFPYVAGQGWLYEPFLDPKGVVCHHYSLRWFFFWLLLALQVVLLIWFGMIIRIAYRVVSGQGADDVRSDDEEDEDDLDSDVTIEDVQEGKAESAGAFEKTAYIEREVNSTDSNFISTPATRGRGAVSAATAASTPVRRSSRRKADGNSTGVNILAGSSDRKELLGRIGCDKPSSD